MPTVCFDEKSVPFNRPIKIKLLIKPSLAYQIADLSFELFNTACDAVAENV